MQTLAEKRVSKSRKLGGSLLLLAVLAAGAGLWFGLRRDPTAQAQASAPTKSMPAMPGMPAIAATPRPGEAMQVDLEPGDLRKANIAMVRVGTGPVASTLRVPGIVGVNEYREVHVTPLVGGIVRTVPVVLGDRVRRGQTMATIFSSDLADAETNYLALSAEFEADHKRLERTQNLVKLGAASRQELDDVTAEHSAHAAHVRAALEKLRELGASGRQIASLTGAAEVEANLTVPAPIDGIVLTRSANLGLVASPAQELFTVADLATVWVLASLNEKDFASVRVGTSASITTPAYPGRVWTGRVTYIEPQVDPATRTARARIEVANRGGDLRLAMYTDVSFAIAGGHALTVPESAVQAIGGKHYVFLPVPGAEGSFAIREVTLGPAGDRVSPITSGLQAGEQVVTDGSFLLKSEALRQHPELQG